MVPTTAQVIAETKRLLMSGAREKRNRLNGSHTNSVTTFTTEASAASIQSGDILEAELELVEVFGDPSGVTVTVIRAANGSTAATHADDTMITINPRFPQLDILNALNYELAALSGEGLFRVLGADLTFDPSIVGYNLGSLTKFLDIYGDPEIESTGTSKYWPQIRNWRLSRGMATGEFASTDALFLYEGGSSGQTVRIRYLAGFSPLSTSDLTLDVATQSGLHSDALDILPIGAAIRLSSTQEIKRNFTESQGEPRRAGEVPPGARNSAPNGLRQLRRDRILEETSRLRRQYPHLRPRV